MTLIHGPEERIMFKSAFLSQFVLIRKEFFKAFCLNYDLQDCPSEIDLAKICQKHRIMPKDLELFNQVMTNEAQTLDMQSLERLDKVVDSLGFDKERAIYYNNSRALLSEADQKNATFTDELTFKGKLMYDVPENVVALKSLKIYKDNEEREVKYI